MRVLLALLALVACALVSAQNNGNIGSSFSQISGYVNPNLNKDPTTNPFPLGVNQTVGQTTWTRRNNLGTAAFGLNVFVLAGFEGLRDANSGQIIQTLRSDVHASLDGGASWKVVSYSNVWRARNALTAVAYSTISPVGQSVTALVFSGGQINGAVIADTWISYDLGASWTLQCFTPEQIVSPFEDGRTNFVAPSCNWKPRYGHSMSATSNGVIILAGGADNVPNGLNDVWRSSDNGVTWTLLNGVQTGNNQVSSPNQVSPAIFRARYNHAMTLTPPANGPTSSFVLIMGGRVPNQLNDVWRSVDALSTANGNLATWELLTAAPGWAPRFGHGATTLQCIGAIYVIGGDIFNAAARQDTSIITSGNDVWVSTTNGQTWSLVATNAGFSVRELFGLVQTSTTLVLLGGVRANANGNFLDFTVASPFYDDVWSTNFAGYQVSAFGSCQCNPQIAGFGTRTRSVSCPASSASGATCCLPPVPVTVESCPCYAWTQTGFGACSVTCGGGIQTQTVSCINTVTGANLGLAGTNTMCDQTLGAPPASVQACNTQACPVCSWTVGNYGPCTQTCGRGIQTRAAPVCADQFGVQRASSDPCCPTVRPATQQDCNTIPCPTHVLGDPEFFGFAGQKYEIHGVPDQVFNIITSPLMQYNALFVYIGHKSAYHCNKTRTHPWTHAGTYLGSLGIQTAGGDKLELHAGTCQKGIKSISLNGHKMKVGERKMLSQVPESGITQQVYFKDIFTVEVRLAEVTLHLTNSDNFFNQEVALTAYGEEKLSTHGLLGQTWNKKTYVVDGVRRVIEGVPTDYLVQEEELFGTNFIYNRFNVKSDE